MVNRVLIDANNFKVSKPGVNVLTANNSQLLIRNDATALGTMQTGTVTPVIYDQFIAYNISRNFLLQYDPQIHPLVNPTNFVPLMHVQRIDDSNSNIAWGGGYYHEYDPDGIYVEQVGGLETLQPGPTSPDSVGYWVIFITRDNANSVAGGGTEIINGVDDFQLRAYQSSTYRYNAFFTKTTDDDLPADVKDRVPDAIDFFDKINLTDNVATNDQTITGIDAGFFIEVQFSSSLSSANSERIVATRTSSGVAPTSFEATSGTSMVINVVPDCTLNFLFEGTASKVLDITLRNLNDSNTVLDTFRLGVNTTSVTPFPAMDWGNISNSGYGENSDQTVQGTNVNITLTAELSATLQSGDYFAVIINNVLTVFKNTNTASFVVSPDDDVRYAVYSANGYSGTITVKNTSDSNAVLDTFTVNVTANNTIPDTFPEWNNLIDSSTTSTSIDTTNTQVVSGFSGNTTMYLNMFVIPTFSGGIGSYDFTVKVYSNGSVVGTFIGGYNTVSIPNNASVYFEATLTVTGVDVQMSGSIDVGTVVGGQNAFLDTISVNMSADEEGGGGGFP